MATGTQPLLSAGIWRKSSYTGSQGNCVEVADLPEKHEMRDSKNPKTGKLCFSSAEWAFFITSVKNGQFS
ncbi:DUF397 domain-containing protein [Salinactinospora qingdaonensis]|uniref:DUF397 domain-containing protein n=1 Tax=Salinactinospora qingdaonensis TaxID=702744 RepID=A0ABP7G700_9ACTN